MAAGAPTSDDAGPSTIARLVPLNFADLAGWVADDHAAALAAFRRGAAVLAEHPPKTRALGIDAAALALLLKRSLEIDDRDARAFFEECFVPSVVEPVQGSAFFTGYYEPEVAGSLAPSSEFRFPLYRPPADLVEITPGAEPGMPADFRFARMIGSGLREHYDRAAIAAGALAGENLELVWLKDPVDAFFIHVQGAARIVLPDGKTLRVTYAAKSGHPYTAIGRLLIERGALTRESATMRGIRAWLAAHPREASSVMNANRSFIYFREADVADPALGPIAAAKVPLTAGRSLAVDRLLHAFHTPVWVETTLPDGGAFHHLAIAQDTGSAIVGPARGDIFFGSGEAAGAIAGEMRAGGNFILLAPRAAP
ncbi:MAG TPA: MltA domain-containing protein [Bauldia sp.]|nr:MltA domain-containing protein [Bauldia sp.]